MAENPEVPEKIRKEAKENAGALAMKIGEDKAANYNATESKLLIRCKAADYKSSKGTPKEFLAPADKNITSKTGKEVLDYAMNTK